MIQIKHIAAQLTERVWAVQVPEWANAFKVNCIPEADFYELDCYELGEYNEPVKEDSISLFPGSWRYICTSKGITEEIAKTIVMKTELGYNGYNCDVDNVLFWRYAVNSLGSLLASKGLTDKNYALIENIA